MCWSILQHSDHSGGDPAFIVSLAGGVSISQLQKVFVSCRGTPPGLKPVVLQFHSYNNIAQVCKTQQLAIS
jgi:hypothetical protein